RLPRLLAPLRRAADVDRVYGDVQPRNEEARAAGRETSGQTTSGHLGSQGSPCADEALHQGKGRKLGHRRLEGAVLAAVVHPSRGSAIRCRIGRARIELLERPAVVQGSPVPVALSTD